MNRQQTFLKIEMPYNYYRGYFNLSNMIEMDNKLNHADDE